LWGIRRRLRVAMRRITISSIAVAALLALVRTTMFVVSEHGTALATLIA